MELFMTKKKDLNPDIMSEISEEELRMSGIYDTHYYNYRCRDCGYEAKVEDIVVDSFPPSPRSKHRMPSCADKRLLACSELDVNLFKNYGAKPLILVPVSKYA